MNYRVDREEAEQAALIYWAKTMEGKIPELKLLHHVPNGGKRDKTTAVRLQRMGVKPGVPDLCLPVPRALLCFREDGGKYKKLYAGLYIEMKARGGKKSENQEKWLKMLDEQGYYCAVCYSYEAAREIIETYLKMEPFVREINAEG